MEAPVTETAGQEAKEPANDAAIKEAVLREVLRAQLKRAPGVTRGLLQTAPQYDGGDGHAQRRPGGSARQTARLAHSGRRATLGMAAVLLFLAGAGALLGTVTGGGGSTPTPQQLGKDSARLPDAPTRQIPASTAALMNLVNLHPRPAPAFTLTDQRGGSVSLAQLDAGHAVVLTFMDDRGADVEPVIARELVAAQRDLGGLATRVDFVAINLNASYNQPRWLREFITSHGLTTVRFTYLSGSPTALRAVWGRFDVQVEPGAPGGGIAYNEVMYFIAPGGVMRYEATPYANMKSNGTGWLPASMISQWASGIADYAKVTIGSVASAGGKGG